jgi:anti-sigma factor RsiW
VTCRELADFIGDYLASGLPEDVRRRFDRHLALCPNCVTYVNNYRSAIAAGQRAFDETEGDVPADVPRELIDGILSATARLRKGTREP